MTYRNTLKNNPEVLENQPRPILNYQGIVSINDENQVLTIYDSIQKKVSVHYFHIIFIK